jgi:hypothetical protein
MPRWGGLAQASGEAVRLGASFRHYDDVFEGGANSPQGLRNALDAKGQRVSSMGERASARLYAAPDPE